jgi:hypothetical protein
MTARIFLRRFALLMLLAAAGITPQCRNAAAQDAAPIPRRPELGNPKPLPPRWNAGITAMQTFTIAMAGKTYFSSSKLFASWLPPDAVVDHYEILASDNISSSSQHFTTNATHLTLTGLKSGTQYNLRLKACRDKSCSQFISADRDAQGATSDEYWQVQGTGNTYATAMRIVSDGNVGAYVIRFGEWAGTDLSGRLQLYYNPFQAAEKGAKPAISLPIAGNIAAASSFTGISGFGLKTPCGNTPPGQPPPNCPGTSLVRNLSLFQAVPMNGLVRMFFEANGTDQKNRILYLDSQDGYIGRDFNRGAGTFCQSMSDYAPGGECEPKVAIGVQGDAVEGNLGIQNVRQFKIIYPKLNDERWDSEAGTPMVFTVNPASQVCSPYNFTQGYAIWNGARWQVQYQANGCPKMFEQMQAPNPVHLGGVRYKLYYNNTAGLRGQPSNPLSDTKPMKVIYADGLLTGNPSSVEFEDWEATAMAREVHYLWPDGSDADLENESKLDDHVTLMPTGDPNFQVMYSNMSGNQTPPAPPFIGMLALINP